MFEQGTYMYLVGARAVGCYEGCGLCIHFDLRMCTVLMAGRILFVHELHVHLYVQHVLLIDDHAYYP